MPLQLSSEAPIAMQTPRFQRIRISLVLLTAVFCQMSFAQGITPSPVAALQPAAQADRISRNADLGPGAQLTGHVPGWATADRQTAAPVDLSSQVRISLVLRRAPAVEAAFDQLLAEQQKPGSPLYHQWLTPQQIGELYGPTASDLAAITSWATAQGLTLVSTQPNRIVVDFTGSLATVANAFHTSFATFHVGQADDDTRLAAIADPSVPAAFASVIQSVHGLSQPRFYSQAKMSLHRLPTPGPKPHVTFTDGSHLILPNDFAMIYDIAGIYSGGNTGATIGSKAQHIAIIGRSRIIALDIANFETYAGLPSIQPTVVLAGNDPGSSNTGDAGEATLDVERVIGTAPGAVPDLVIAASTVNDDGVDIATAYNINTQRDPIMTISFGSCEAENGSTETNYLNSQFQTAAGEGISTFISSGDSGAASCDTSFQPAPASQSRGISALCASTYITCVGGTEFNDIANPGAYWSATNSGSGLESALQYIPEGAWNEPTTVNGSNQTVLQVAAGGGGASIYIAKPSWQTGTGVPVDGARDVPDVAFSSAGHDGYLGCFAAGGADCVQYVSVFSGTSAAAPGMAGIAALLNTKAGAAEGNISPLLYSIAATTPTAFHDATIATSGVASCTTATPSMCNNSTPGSSTLTGGLAGYALTTGYDLATGLGSLDVAKFLAAVAASTVSTSLSAAAAPNPAVVNQTVTLTATLTPGASSSTPTGTVQFYANNSTIGSPATLTANAASITYSFGTAGAYSITAVYSGDTKFTTSTSSAVSLTINTPSFTVTPATTTYNLISGATSGNADTIAVASTSSFAGVVALNCVVTSASGTAAGSCSITPPSATLTSGSSSNSTLLITTIAGTSGVLNIHVMGSNGSTTINSAPIVVNLTAASFTMSSLPTTINLISGSSATSTVTLTSTNGFAGTVALTCAAANLGSSGTAAGACSVLPASVTLTAGGTATTVATIATTIGTFGALTATISGSGATAGATIAATSFTTVVATLTAPSFTLAASPTTLAFTSGATSGNTDTITVASANGFTGPVALACSISSGSAAYPPTCSISPATVTVSASGTAPTAVVTVNSTVQTAALDRRWTVGNTTFIAFLLFLPALRRRRKLLALALLFCGISAISGCGGSSTPAPAAPKSSAGTYTVTIIGTGTTTGSSIATTASANFSLTIN